MWLCGRRWGWLRWARERANARPSPPLGGFRLLLEADERTPRYAHRDAAVAHDDLQVGQCDTCMLASNRFGTRAFAPLDCLDHRAVLTVSSHEDLTRFG